MSRAALTGALIACLGCSIAGMGKRVPANYHPRNRPDCSWTGPVVADTLGSLVGIVIGSVLSSLPVHEMETPGVASTTVGVFYGVSAAVGTALKQECDSARQAHRLWRPPPADLGHRAGAGCYPNHTCDRGLECASNVCVRAVPAGTAGGACYPNATCALGLSCQLGICHGVAREGTFGGACYPNASCDAGLVCVEAHCARRAATP